MKGTLHSHFVETLYFADWKMESQDSVVELELEGNAPYFEFMLISLYLTVFL